MKGRNKVWHAGRASQRELDEIDRCGLCRILPELEQKCWAAAYCHRQMRMKMETEGENDDRKREIDGHASE